MWPVTRFQGKNDGDWRVLGCPCFCSGKEMCHEILSLHVCAFVHDYWLYGEVFEDTWWNRSMRVCWIGVWTLTKRLWLYERFGQFVLLRYDKCSPLKSVVKSVVVSEKICQETGKITGNQIGAEIRETDSPHILSQRPTVCMKDQSCTKKYWKILGLNE